MKKKRKNFLDVQASHCFLCWTYPMGAFKLTKQLACLSSDWIWFVFTYKSN